MSLTALLLLISQRDSAICVFVLKGIHSDAVLLFFVKQKVLVIQSVYTTSHNSSMGEIFQDYS